MDYRAIIFDLDGTLLDTLGDIAAALNRALTKNGLSALEIETVRDCVGNGTGRLIKLALGEREELYDAVFADYTQDYLSACNVTTRPYEGIEELLGALVVPQLAVVSNKPQAAAEGLIAAHFPKVFSCVIGDAPGRRRKPAPDSVLLCMERSGVKKEEILYVGDSEVDIETARAAGIKCVSVSWGFRGTEQLLAAGAEEIIDEPAQLLAYLK